MMRETMAERLCDVCGKPLSADAHGNAKRHVGSACERIGALRTATLRKRASRLRTTPQGQARRPGRN